MSQLYYLPKDMALFCQDIPCFLFVNNVEIPSQFSCKNLECQNQANTTGISLVRISSCKSLLYGKNI